MNSEFISLKGKERVIEAENVIEETNNDKAVEANENDEVASLRAKLDQQAIVRLSAFATTSVSY